MRLCFTWLGGMDLELVQWSFCLKKFSFLSSHLYQTWFAQHAHLGDISIKFSFEIFLLDFVKA